MKYKLSKYVVITDFIDDVLENQLVYSTRSGNVIILNKSTIELLKSATLNTIDFELLDKLITSQIIVPKFENEFETKVFTINTNEDVAIAGLGWINVKRGPLKIEITLPKGVKLIVRSSMFNKKK